LQHDYPNALHNVDFRRSLLQQCASIKVTLKHYPIVSVYPTPRLSIGRKGNRANVSSQRCCWIIAPWATTSLCRAN